jgi:hypothetical protein
VLLLELEGIGVFARDIDGTIYSRRMRRDHAKAIKDKANGKGGGNPRLKNGVNPPDKGEDKAQKPEARVDRIGSAGASNFTEGSKASRRCFLESLGFRKPVANSAEFRRRRLAGDRMGARRLDGRSDRYRSPRIGPDKPLTYHEKVLPPRLPNGKRRSRSSKFAKLKQLTVTHGKPKSAIIQAADDLCRKLPASMAREDLTSYAAMRAKLLLGCYRTGDANDPEDLRGGDHGECWRAIPRRSSHPSLIRSPACRRRRAGCRPSRR